MSSQHLSDEAVAAFADGVLGGHARERATRHVNSCAECRQAVQVQREAALALRTASAPALPGGLLDRLRGLPMTTPVTTLPTVLTPDGTTMLSTLGSLGAPMAAAAFVPSPAAPRSHPRIRPVVTTVAVVALAGVLAVGSAAPGSAQTGGQHTGGAHPVNDVRPVAP